MSTPIAVFLATDAVISQKAKWAKSNYFRLLRLAKADSTGETRLVSTPELADLIVIAETRDYYQSGLIRSEFYAKYGHKVIVYSEADNSIPRVPGIYMRVPFKDHDRLTFEYGFYSRVNENRKLERISLEADRPYLASFIGNTESCSRLRKAILKIRDDRFYCAHSGKGLSDETGVYEKVMERSNFVLCPRGSGPCTYRLFEALRVGRAPVIISDEWRPIRGIDWSQFAVRVSESKVAELPDILAELEPRAIEMGRQARSVYEKHFADGVAFRWIANTGLGLLLASKNEKTRYTGPLLYKGLGVRQIKSTFLETLRYLFVKKTSFVFTEHS